MADRNKFEEMLERLINEDKEGAEELFHEIVVEKSRDIYESLLAEETDDEEEVEEASDEEVEEDSDEEEVEEGFDLDEFEVAPMEVGGDETDDLEMDVDMGGDAEGGDDMGMDMDMGGEEEGDTEERLDDLEDALDELKAEFEKLMAGEEGEEEHGDMDFGGDEAGEEEGGEEEEGDDEEVDESDDEEVEEKSAPKNDIETMREYVEKVTAKMGDTGTNGTKSAVAGKNDMGGTTANIAKGGSGSEKGTGAKAPKEDSAGNVNVPGGKASKSLSSVSKPKMGDTGTNGTKSIIGQ